MKILIVTDNPRGKSLWPAWLRSKGYDTACQDIQSGGIVLYPHGDYPAILMHLTASRLDGALATVRMFHKCHPHARIVAVTDGIADNRAFTEAGATVHLSEPVDHALVFRMMELLLPKARTNRLSTASQIKTQKGLVPFRHEYKPLAQPAE